MTVNSTSFESDNKPNRNDIKDFVSVTINNQNFGNLAGNMANEDSAVNSVAASSTDDSSISDSADRSKEYKHLIEYGLDSKVANRLDDIFKTGKNMDRNYLRADIQITTIYCENNV